MILDFNNLHKFTIGRSPRKDHTVLFKSLPIGIVELETVPVALIDQELAIHLIGLRPLLDDAWIASKAHCSAFLLDFFSAAPSVDDRIAGPLVELCGVCLCQIADIARKLNRRTLHSEHMPKNGIPCSRA